MDGETVPNVRIGLYVYQCADGTMYALDQKMYLVEGVGWSGDVISDTEYSEEACRQIAQDHKPTPQQAAGILTKQGETLVGIIERPLAASRRDGHRLWDVAQEAIGAQHEEESNKSGSPA